MRGICDECRLTSKFPPSPRNVRARGRNRPVAGLRRLWPAQDRERLDVDLAAFLDESRRRYVANPHLRPLFDLAADFVLRGEAAPAPALPGQLPHPLRPGIEPPAPVWLAAASLELFHAFMLVHDDLIDGSVIRRDRPTLHEAIRLDADRPDGPPSGSGRDLGLIAGDLLFALGMRLLNRSGLDDAALGRANRLLADMLFETGLGEALDVLYDDCPLERPERGADRRGVPPEDGPLQRLRPAGPGGDPRRRPGRGLPGPRPLRRPARASAIQVQNDLDALDEDPEFGDHPDLDGGKRTLRPLEGPPAPPRVRPPGSGRGPGLPAGPRPAAAPARPDRRQRRGRRLPGPPGGGPARGRRRPPRSPLDPAQRRHSSP